MAAAIEVPERFNAATHFLDRHIAEGRGGRVAFRFEGRTMVYAELALRANRLGNALLASGLQMEQRVLLALADRPEFAEAFWGAMKIGAVPVPVSDGLDADDLAFRLQDTRARVAIASEPAAARIVGVRARCPLLEVVVVVGGRRRGAVEYERLLERAAPELDPADTSRDDAALWLYTSGSTGRPKAAVHLHHDLVYAAELVGRGVFGVEAQDVTFSVSKLHFAFGLGNSLYFPALVGAASVLMPEWPDAERILGLIEAERPTLLFAVPTVYRRLLQVEGAERRFDLSSLRLCVSSGEALPPALFHAWKSRFGHELLDVVGSTEALHDYIANRPGEARPGSGGRLVPGFEARLVDDRGHPVAPGMIGQLLIKGDSTAACYWNRHEET
ncbi:MAG TPA: AMP-binding protein, partial [Candidatus Bathyarchaeia archaeon]|nr:AMP-binding protein [Candidatus Bathyarchaeia archaeon]